MVARCRSSVVGIATALLVGRSVVRNPAEVRFFSSSPNRLVRLWGPPNTLFNGYQGQSGRYVKLTTYYYLVPRLRMGGVILT